MAMDFLKFVSLTFLLFLLPLPCKTYDMFYLALQWPNARCNTPTTSHCIDQVPQDFTVHGLWPGYWKGGIQINCPAPDLSKSQVATFYDELEMYWTGLFVDSDKQVDPNMKFWRYQWKKHGSCSGMEPHKYFSEAIKIRKMLNLLAILDRAQIRPGDKKFTPVMIRTTIENALRVTPVVVCNKDSNGNVQLLELQLCFMPPQSRESDFELHSCRRRTSIDCIDEHHRIVFAGANTLWDWNGGHDEL